MFVFCLERKNMRKEKRKICGTCKHNKQEVPFGEHYCKNPESDCYECECTFTDSCIDYEERLND